MNDYSEYECNRCGYSTTVKANLLSHLRRKKPCKTILSDIPTETLLSQIIRSKCGTVCDMCGKTYANRPNLLRHMKICNMHNQDTDITRLVDEVTSMKSVIEQQQQQINTLLDQSHATVQIKNHNHDNTIIQNIQNIVVNNAPTKIREFGCENMKAVPTEWISSCFMDLKFRELLESLHFDPNFPENNNIRIKSIKREMAEIYSNNKWFSVPMTEGLHMLIDQGTRIFKEYARKDKKRIIEEDIDEDEYDKNMRDLRKYEELDKKMIVETLKKLRCMLDTAKTDEKCRGNVKQNNFLTEQLSKTEDDEAD